MRSDRFAVVTKAALFLATGLSLSCSANPTTTIPSVASATIGASGGSVTLPGGAWVVVPEGALAQDVQVNIALATDGFPAIAGEPAPLEVYAFTPHGQTFSKPVTIRVPTRGDTVLELLVSQPGGDWSSVADAQISGDFLEAQVTHFSYYNGHRKNRTDAGTNTGLTDGGPTDGGGIGACRTSGQTCGGNYPCCEGLTCTVMQNASMCM